LQLPDTREYRALNWWVPALVQVYLAVCGAIRMAIDGVRSDVFLPAALILCSALGAGAIVFCRVFTEEDARRAFVWSLGGLLFGGLSAASGALLLAVARCGPDVLLDPDARLLSFKICLNVAVNAALLLVLTFLVFAVVFLIVVIWQKGANNA